MAKILLVEDDTNLQDIYAARLGAEGHEVTSATDGESALASAVKVLPDLVILDVMMPKISGFDVLDILRTTPETKDAKVIMMTALSQDEDRQRGIKMGANRYLVKSQVTLEDVITAVNEELTGNITPPATAQDVAATTTTEPATSNEPQQQAVADNAMPAVSDTDQQIAPLQASTPAADIPSEAAPLADSEVTDSMSVTEDIQTETVTTDAPSTTTPQPTTHSSQLEQDITSLVPEIAPSLPEQNSALEQQAAPQVAPAAQTPDADTVDPTPTLEPTPPPTGPNLAPLQPSSELDSVDPNQIAL